METPPSPCADISGNYAATVTRISGSCDPKIDGDGTGTATFARNGAGWQLVTPGVQGGCPASLDTATCKLTATCNVEGKDGGLIISMALEYVFTSNGYSGTTVNHANPPLVEKSCSVNYRETATKL